MPVPGSKNELGVGVVVLEYGPQAWYLLRDGPQLYLDVNCNHSFVSYSFTMQLHRDEAAKYRRQGRAYLDELAQVIQYAGPGSSDGLSAYKVRNLAPDVSARVNGGIKLWLSAKESENHAY
jgi:hypothetical protein